MNKYLIALDMDGTLLNDDKKISFKTRNILKKHAEHGHIVMIASGRPYRAIASYYEELKLNSPIILYNGAFTFIPHDPSYRSVKRVFPKDVILNIYNEVKPYVLNLMLESEHNIWIDKYDEFLDKFFWFKGMDVHEGDIVKNLDRDPLTFVAHYIEGKDVEDKIRAIVDKYPGISVRFWGGSPYFELYFTDVSKGASVSEVAKQFNIPKERIIAFGDSYNDLEMFSIAGTSIAMANAFDEAKNAATIIAKYDNNHNGIYYALKDLNLL